MLGDGEPRRADARAEIRGSRVRFTVLTSRLIRMEWSEDEAFVDDATTVVVDRAFPVPEFHVARDGDAVTVRTDRVELHYDGHGFSAEGLSVRVFGAPDSAYATWHFGAEPPQELPHRGNLGGTARTLDGVDGACEIEPGILATYGFAVLDDSTSPVLTRDGWVSARPAGGHDLYLFAHGRDYRGALDDYFRLTGRPALVPRFVLGNWWSRYWAYRQDEYLALFDGFDSERLPFSVAVLDMDWHLVDIDPELGTGWTGYTWNRELFPDPPGMLAELHRRGLAVTLNVHPADGVRSHEDAYAAMAEAMDVDPASGAQIPFDITSQRFVDAYLAHLNHPLERDGVDFWWLDWQSGGVSRIRGLDPLWMLNHIHFTDSGRDGRRPLTFSRYAGPGSHRYPVGFSGDTIATWESLDFQPSFTSTAANIGFFWWSHDIGGHMEGVTDPELITRWVQFGVLSPVNRLHSSASPFASKEPSLLEPEARAIVGDFLRLRHVLLPYLYTAAWMSHRDGVGLVRPLYHDHPGVEAAYEHANAYLLGPDLLVAPITSPRDPATRLATSVAWLPDGWWTDVLTGRTYRGGRTAAFHRVLRHVPVLARAGSVLPLQADALADSRTNPDVMVLRVFPGTGESTLIEDDGSAEPTPWVTTIAQRSTARDDGALDLTIGIATGDGAPGRIVRALALDLAGIESIESASLVVGGDDRPLDVADRDDDAGTLLGPALRVRAEDLDLHRPIAVQIRGARRRREKTSAAIGALLAEARIEVRLKDRAYAACGRLEGVELVAELSALGLPAALIAAAVEILTEAHASGA